MAIEPHPKGWKVTVDTGADPVTGKRSRRSLIVEGPKKQARDVEAKLRLEGRDRTTAKSLTVGALIEAWYEHVQHGLSPTTRQGYRSKIDTYLIPAFGKLPARKLTSARIDALYRRLRKEGARGRPLSPATIRRVHAALSSACGQAVKWGWMPANPCELATVGPQIHHEIEPPSLEEILRVVEQADQDLRDVVGLAIGTGARRGELCGVQWADVDVDEAAITIRRSVGSINGKAVIIDDYRKSKIRTVAIDSVTLDMLKARRARHLELALACGLALEPAGFVFADEPGQRSPLPPQLVSHRWRMAAKRAGVHARLHDVRHFHVTELLAAGIPMPNVVKRAGWASPQMLHVYAHAVEKLDRTAADVIGRRLTAQ